MIDILRRLVSLDWKMLATTILWDFAAELYREEFEAVYDAIDGVFHGPDDLAESYYADGRKTLDQIAKAIGENHPKVIALTARLSKARALKSVKTKHDSI